MDKRAVTILVLGDTGVGKSTLITSFIYDAFQTYVPSVLSPCIEDRNGIETEIIDTDAQSVRSIHLLLESINANEIAVICIVSANNEPASVDHVSSKWLPLIKKFNVQFPIILVYNKIVNLAQEAIPPKSVLLSQQCFEKLQQELEHDPQIEHYFTIEFGQLNLIQKLFHIAQRLAVFPACKLILSTESGITFRPTVISSLERIFRLIDLDGDGYLNLSELNAFHSQCFPEGKLSPSLVQELQETLKDVVPGGFSEGKGFNIQGFVGMWYFMFEHGSFEAIWTMLRYFDYDDSLHLRGPELEAKSKLVQPGTLELTKISLDFLAHLYNEKLLQSNRGNSTNFESLSLRQVDELFLLHPDRLPPWSYLNITAPIQSVSRDKVYINELDDDDDNQHEKLPLSSFLALWHATTFLDPSRTRLCLNYLGYNYEHLHPRQSKSLISSIPPPLAPCDHSTSIHLVVIYLSPNCEEVSLLQGLINKPFFQSASLGEPQWAIDTMTRATDGLIDDKGKRPFNFVKREKSSQDQYLLIHFERTHGPSHILKDAPYLHLTSTFCVLFDYADYQSFDYVKQTILRFSALWPNIPLVLAVNNSPLDAPPHPEGAIFSKQLDICQPIVISTKNNRYNNLLPILSNKIEQFNSNKSTGTSNWLLGLMGMVMLTSFVYVTWYCCRPYRSKWPNTKLIKDRSMS